MKGLIRIILFLIAGIGWVDQVYCQSETVIPPSNRSSVNLEKNLLFYADKRLTVTQQGSTSLPLDKLFDGNYLPNYSGALQEANPWVLTIEDVTGYHVQAGAWIGWTTRYYHPIKFKIEVYDQWAGTPSYHTWVTVADVDNYQGGSYITQLPQCIPNKVRFTFYKGEGPANSIGLSELFLLHNEAATAYDGLMVKYNHEGNILIGKTDQQNTSYKVDVAGPVRANEIVVNTTGADFVFDSAYKLLPLPSVERYVKAHNHLPDIPSASQMKEQGMAVGELNKRLLQKVEELTLYVIQQQKALLQQRLVNRSLQKQINQLKPVRAPHQ